MVYQPPTGSRDLLPLDVAQKLWIENRLQSVFHGSGYDRIMPSTLERMETLMAGGAIDSRKIFQLQGAGEEALGLRPELTASIARTVATRMMGGSTPVNFPVRLYYNANLFCRSLEDAHSSQHEFYQAGVELLGVGGTLADAEVILLGMDCLGQLGLGPLGLGEACQILLGEAGLTRSLLSVFPEGIRRQVRDALANLDRVGLEALALTPPQQRQALILMDLRGTPDSVLGKVKQLDLNASQQAQVVQLKALVDLLQSRLGANAPIVLDLSLIHTFDYYTGVVFDLVACGQVVGQGGRYDRLLEIYHPQARSIPGVGFGLHLDRLQQVLLPLGQLPTAVAASDCLVVPKSHEAQAFALKQAEVLRGENRRVEVSLVAARDRATALDYARSKGIAKIAWVDGLGDVQMETVTQ
jgi:ATP phosphoribosyltransferase regulatory subunit